MNIFPFKEGFFFCKKHCFYLAYISMGMADLQIAYYVIVIIIYHRNEIN